MNITAQIQVSYNPLVANSPVGTQFQRDNLICALTRFSVINRNGKKVTISGFPVGDNYIFYPLFRKNGHKQHKITIAEYHNLIQNAEISIWKTKKIPDGFVEKVYENHQVIRDYLISIVPG